MFLPLFKNNKQSLGGQSLSERTDGRTDGHKKKEKKSLASSLKILKKRG